MSHQTARAALAAVLDFLDDYPEVRTPTVQVDADGFTTLRWHIDREPLDVAIDVLRVFDGWVMTPLDTCTTYRTRHNGLELIVFAAKTHQPSEPVNLLDALAEVTA